MNLKGNTLDGIFSHIVTDMIYTACGECPAYGFTEINLASNGNGQRSGKESLVDVLGDIDEVPQISFPIYGNRYVTRFGGVHPYVNLVESPGLAFVAAKKAPGAAARNIVSAVFSCFPLLLLFACMAFLSGFIIWLLVSIKYFAVIHLKKRKLFRSRVLDSTSHTSKDNAIMVIVM